MDNKERLLKRLNKRLTIDQKGMFGLVTVEQQKDTVVFRMPIGLVTLENVWEIIQEIASEEEIVVKQAGQFATLEELDEILGDIQWLWEKWIPRGFVTMFAGDPGVGKSAIVQWLVKVVTEGLPFPLEFAPQKTLGTVVWVDTEASHQLIKVRATSMQMDKKRVFIPVITGDILAQADLGSTGHRDAIIELVEGTQATLLILDSLGGSHGKGENKVEDIRPIMEFLTLLARDYQMAVVAIHHLNKGHKDESPETSLYRLRGSTIIPAMCRSIIAVEKATDEGNIRLRQIKNNLAKPPQPIIAKSKLNDTEELLGFEFFPYEKPQEKHTKKEQCADWILSQLRKAKKGVSPTTLAEWSEGAYTRQMIYAARASLGDRIIEGGTGNDTRWSITKKDDISINKVLGNNGNHPKPIKKSGDKQHGRKKAKRT